MITLQRPPTPRRDAGLYGYERTLSRCGLSPVAGADEAGRGACAGPLVVAAVVLAPGRRGEIPGLADSKLLSPQAREQVYGEVLARAAAWSVVVIAPREIERIGLHVANVEGMRRAFTRLSVKPEYVLTDGFPVAGVGVPGLAVWKGDRVIACIAAASVVAKVTRDRIMVDLHEEFPGYDFAVHKGYCTPEHQSALDRLGPSRHHRFNYVNVIRAAASAGGGSWEQPGNALPLRNDLVGETAVEAGHPRPGPGVGAGQEQMLLGEHWSTVDADPLGWRA